MDEKPQLTAAGDVAIQVTDTAAEAIRSLNHETRSDMCVPDVYQVIGNLSTLTHRLPQALDQLTRILERALQGRELRVDLDAADHVGDPLAAITAAAGALDHARIATGELNQLLETAQQALAWVSEEHGGAT